MRPVQGIRVVSVLALLIGFMLAGASRAAAGDGGFSLTIHAAECFHGVGPDIFEECHHDVESGTAFFENGDGTVTLSIPDETLEGYLGAYIYCRDLVDDEVLFDGNYADTGGGAVFPVEDGDEIVCDIYLITPALADDGKDTGGSTTGGTTALPATGTGPAPAGQALTLLLGLLAAGLALLGLHTRRALR